jgi:3-hydroxyisobutyrate dehydrogenase
MGSAMARNLARAGHDVRAWNRTSAHAQPLIADGIQVADSLTETVDGVDVVVTMLFDATAVAEVMNGAGPSLRPGSAWIQSTTVSTDDTTGFAALAERHHVSFYDAPVSGTREPAEAGKLVVIAAGPDSGHGLVDPVFDAIGSRTIWTSTDGASAAATKLKLVVNSWVLAASNAAGEVVALAQALSVDPQQFLDVIAGGPLDLPFLRLKVGLILDDKLNPASFAVGTSRKDAHLIADAAVSAGVTLDGAEAFAARLDRAAIKGHSADDIAATYYASF